MDKTFKCGSKIKLFFSLCNEIQLDAMFVLSLFRQSTSTCFGHICSPSSGGILYVYNNWYVLFFSVDCLLAQHYQLFYIYIYIYIYIYTYTISPDDGLQICPKYVEVDWRNKLSINSISSWVSLQRCIEMHGPKNQSLLFFSKIANKTRK